MNGRLQLETVSSVVLKGNALGDPRRREIPVYLPPSHGAARGRRYPTIYVLPGFTGTGRGAVNVDPWKENVVERFDRLVAEGRARECILVVADGWTAYGGSQYLNSEATGRYQDFVADELPAFVADKFAAASRALSRAVVGSSSGGFGALTLGMERPDVFGHVAAHSADLAFEVCYLADVPRLVTALSRHGGSPARFLKAFRAARDKSEFDHAAVNLLAMASCYSPSRRSPLGFDLPCDPVTGAVDPAVWARWKRRDPVAAAPRHRAALKGLGTLYFDCGLRDEHGLHVGARQLSAVLKALGVRHVHEEHGGGHRGLGHRYERSLALLSRRLKA